MLTRWLQLVDWLETFEVGTQGYDSGLDDAVMEAATFGDDETEWKCIQSANVDYFC